MSSVSDLFNHPILDAYLKMNFITSLMPTTLIPLGVLMAVYSTLSKQEVQRGGFQAMSVTDPLIERYMSLFGLYEVTALTLVPFAFLLGRDIFEKVLKGYEKAEGVVSPLETVQRGGSPNWMDIPILDTFLKIQGNVNITPATLVPFGILMIVYYVIRGKKAETAQRGGSSMPAFLSNPNLKKYLEMMGITAINSQTLLPFALIISKELFDKYVMQQSKLMTKLEEITQG
jgi:ABC-type Fe3+ transport system permease subunit